MFTLDENSTYLYIWEIIIDIMMAVNALTVAKPRMLGSIHPQFAFSRQNSLHIGIYNCSDKVLRSTIANVSTHLLNFL